MAAVNVCACRCVLRRSLFPSGYILTGFAGSKGPAERHDSCSRQRFSTSFIHHMDTELMLHTEYHMTKGTLATLYVCVVEKWGVFFLPRWLPSSLPMNNHSPLKCHHANSVALSTSPWRDSRDSVCVCVSERESERASETFIARNCVKIKRGYSWRYLRLRYMIAKVFLRVCEHLHNPGNTLRIHTHVSDGELSPWKHCMKSIVLLCCQLLGTLRLPFKSFYQLHRNNQTHSVNQPGL